MSVHILDNIIGANSGLKNVSAKIHEYAHLDQPITLMAENGAGKEAIARAVHKSSKRSSATFLRVNCASIPKALQREYIFGKKDAKSVLELGWFGRANRGTLLLDEVNSLTRESQNALLEILMYNTLTNDTGNHIKTDVRLIASASKAMNSLVNDGYFLQQLWDKLSVFTIKIPPLRERFDDIAELAEYFAKRAAERLGFYPRSLSENDIEILKSYKWPGNVRELASVMERAVILGEGKTLRIKEALGSDFANLSNPEPLDTVIKNHIENVLRYCNGRVEGDNGAARILDINPNTLRGKMKKLNINPNRFKER